MLRTLIARLWRRTPTLVDTGVMDAPVRAPVAPPTPPPPPPRVQVETIEPQLRFVRNDMLVLPGAAVVTKKNAVMIVARVPQKPPYVKCLYRGRQLAVRAENIGCYWATVQ